MLQRRRTTWGGHCTVKLILGGVRDTAHTFLIWVNNWGVEGGGDTAHTLLMRGTMGVGTPHNIESKSNSLN